MTPTQTVRALLTNNPATFGIRVLIHGAAGSGKAATVALLGKEMKRQVVRVNLTQLISKYGEASGQQLSECAGGHSGDR